jgi:hypothetical protein
MITAVRSAFGFSAFSARNLSSPGQLSEAKPIKPTCMNPRREMGPAQRTCDGGLMMEDMR